MPAFAGMTGTIGNTVDRKRPCRHGPRREGPLDSKINPAPSSEVAIGGVRFGNRLPLALIAGPCALESRAHAFDMAAALKEITARLNIGFVYKTSFDKANRTSAASARGLGLDKALSIF